MAGPVKDTYGGDDPYQPPKKGTTQPADKPMTKAEWEEWIKSQNFGGGGTTINLGGGGANKKERTANMAAELADRAKQLGLAFSDKEIADMAKKAVDNNWSETVILDTMLEGQNWQNITGGDMRAGIDMLKALSASYMLPVSDQQAEDWAMRMAKGELTQAGVTNMIQAQAKARYQWMAPMIDQGVRPGDYFEPLKQVIANTLEVAPGSINLLDDKWLNVVEVQDSKTGATRAATMTEVAAVARRQPEWSQTRQAREIASQAGRQLAEAFGRA